VLEDRTVPASLSYSTYFHGAVYATAVDSAGDVYVTGNTDSNLPTTPGAFQTTGSGAFVAELNAAGSALLYATYLGSSGPIGGLGTGITVDAAGDAFVIGQSNNVPTTSNAIASSASGANNVFIAELNPTGSGLVYSTYLPGAVGLSLTQCNSGAIAVDGSGNIYVAGAAEAGLPVTAGAYQQSYLGPKGEFNAFFAKINPALSGAASVSYASYLGGTGSLGDAALGIAVYGSGNPYLEGYTTSNDFPTTSGAFQRNNNYSPLGDVFVAKFNPALSGTASLAYSTYLGGSVSGVGSNGYVKVRPNLLTDHYPAGGIAVDSAGNAYITGGTTSTSFPTTPGAYQVTSNIVNSSKNSSSFPPSDVFVTKLNATGTALVYSTYLGGGGSKQSGGTHSDGISIAVDASGDAHVTGWTDSSTFPTVNALQTTYAGNEDAFVTVLNPSGSGLLFSSYFGGSSYDYGFSIALDAAGNAYVAGNTFSSNFPTTPGALQTTPGSGYILKIDPPADGHPATPPVLNPPASPFGSFAVPTVSTAALVQAFMQDTANPTTQIGVALPVAVLIVAAAERTAEHSLSASLSAAGLSVPATVLDGFFADLGPGSLFGEHFA
jgi:hypothetical protein